jgi:hypothetical protein
MKTVITLLALSNFPIASTAVAVDWTETLRDRHAHCNEFVIYDPDAKLLHDHLRDCCVLGRIVRGCQPLDGSPTER